MRDVERLEIEIVRWAHRWYSARCTCGARSDTHNDTCEITRAEQDGSALVNAHAIACVEEGQAVLAPPRRSITPTAVGTEIHVFNSGGPFGACIDCGYDAHNRLHGTSNYPARELSSANADPAPPDPDPARAIPGGRIPVKRPPRP